MKTIKKLFLALAAITLVTASVFAQDKAGTTSMQFLKIMPCARATSLGDAYVSVASGVEALYWNPAGLAFAENQEFSLTYVNWIFDSKLYDIAYAMPMGDFGALGLQLRYVDYGNFDESIAWGDAYYQGQTQPYLTGRTFKPYDYVVGLTYAKKMTEKFAFGLTAKYAYESLYDKDITTYATDQNGNPSVAYTLDPNRGVFLFDAGFRYNTGFRTIQIAAAAQNFGSDVPYITSDGVYSYPAPMAFRLGASGDVIGKNSLFLEDSENRVGVTFDLFLANDATQQEHLGVEYEFANTFAVRVGYKFNYSTEGLSFGGGVKETIGNIKLSVDYSFGAMDAIISDYTGNVHRISIGVGIQ